MPPILRVVWFSVFFLTGYFGQGDDLYTGREALIVHLFGGGSNHVTSLAQKETNQGSIQFHSFYFFIFSIAYFRTLGTMFDLSVRGEKRVK